MSKRVLLSAGPIPARVDSVKYLTNRFKGRAMLSIAEELRDMGNNVNLIMWKHADICKEAKASLKYSTIYLVEDVYDYYKIIEAMADRYDGFVLGAAVANLTPVEPFEGKFPSHLYKEGDKFNIEFTISPRAIDIVKKKNPRCCLIGYKLFDGSYDELISAARETLKNSKANGIFANNPNNVGTKHLVLPEGGVIKLGFDDHIEWIHRMLNLEYFKSDIDARVDIDLVVKTNKLRALVIEHFEKYIRKGPHGACAVLGYGCILTTSRHHDGVSYVTHIDEEKRSVKYVGRKPTKNAPLLCAQMYEDKRPYFTIVHHHHGDRVCKEIVKYRFPGTTEDRPIGEGVDYNICGHGSIEMKKVKHIEWDKYYEMYPTRYFSTHPEIEKIYDMPDEFDTLDVGSNTRRRAKYWLDPNIIDDAPGRVTYETLGKYDAIAINNAINYLDEIEISALQKSLKPGGILVANTFSSAPKSRITETEIINNNNEMIQHILWDKKTQTYYAHYFHIRHRDFWRRFNFEVEEYNDGKSLLLRYRN